MVDPRWWGGSHDIGLRRDMVDTLVLEIMPRHFTPYLQGPQVDGNKTRGKGYVDEFGNILHCFDSYSALVSTGHVQAYQIGGIAVQGSEQGHRCHSAYSS